MKIDILTLFPEMFKGPLSESLIKKGEEKGLIKINIVDIRNFTTDKHNKVDSSPYGGGAGMVIKAEPLYNCLTNIIDGAKNHTKIIFMSPAGKKLTNNIAKYFAEIKHLVIICGHYETIDERLFSLFDIEEISIGDYVLTGGEIPAMVLTDVIARFIPNIIKEEDSVKNDSFYHSLLDYPSYTKPDKFMEVEVPEVLISGNHSNIASWRRKESLKRTIFRRGDLMAEALISKNDIKLINEILTGS